MTSLPPPRPDEAAGQAAVVTVECLSLLDDAATAELTAIAASGNVSLQLRRPASLLEARELIAKHPAHAVLTNNGAIAKGDVLLSTLIHVRCISHPTVLLWHRGPIDPKVREKLRIGGVAAIVDENSLADVLRVVGVRQGLVSRLDQIPLDNMLQTIEQRPGEHMVTVECPHWQALSGYAWRRTSTRFCHGDESGDGSCKGWFGRVYVRKGGLFHAETPYREGIRALARMLELKAGVARVQPLLLQPSTANLSGTAQQCIIRAAVVIDELAREREKGTPTGEIDPRELADFDNPIPFADDDVTSPGDEFETPLAPEIVAETAVATIPPPAIEVSASRADEKQAANQGADVSQLDRLLTSISGLRGAARCDSKGWVDEVEGAMDAESMCAAVAMSREPLEQAGAMVGLGDVEGWSLVTGTNSMYVIGHGGGYIASVGNATKGPEAVLRKLSQLLAKS